MQQQQNIELDQESILPVVDVSVAISSPSKRNVPAAKALLSLLFAVLLILGYVTLLPNSGFEFSSRALSDTPLGNPSDDTPPGNYRTAKINK